MELFFDDKENKYKSIILRHIFPFSLDLDSENLTDFADAHLTEVLSKKGIGDYPKGDNSELYEHIKNLVVPVNRNGDDWHSKISNATIGVHFIKGIKIGENNLATTKTEFILVNNEFNLSIEVPYIQLYVFKTGIAFLSIPIEVNHIETVEQLVELSALLKSVKQSKRYSKKDETLFKNFYIKLTPKKTSKDDVVKPTLMTYEEWIASLTKEFANVKFFNGGMRDTGGQSLISKVSVPHKALVFSSFCGNRIQYDKDCINNLIRLSKGYDSKYGISDEHTYDYATDMKLNEVLAPFDDVFWSVSREGICNMVLSNGNSEKAFFSNGYSDRIAQNYIYFHILALHQYYGLIHLGNQISHLPNTLKAYTSQEKKLRNQTKANYNRLVNLQDQIYFFYLKCIYEDISHISHQESLYKSIKSALGIKEMMIELDFEITKLGQLAKDIRTNELEIIEKKRTKRINFLTTGGGVLVFFTAYDALSRKVTSLCSWILGVTKINHPILNKLSNQKLDSFSEFLLTLMFLLVIYVIGYVLEKIVIKYNTK